MKAYIAVTDTGWFDFLRSREGVDEVNFWQPSGGRRFRALSTGEPLLFKLHHPDNYIVGGGFFWHFSILPSRLAWDAFGENNGTPTYAEMRRRVARYRRSQDDPKAEYEIGCILLLEPFFLDREDWIPCPPDFSKNIVQGKTYDLSSAPGRGIWERIRAVRDSWQVRQTVFSDEPSLIYRRLGQGTFRILVTDNYERRCAVTRERTLPVLEAAHIQPVSDGGRHEASNGLLLRSDLHTLFDRGYVTVDPELRFEVSRRLKEDYENGRDYYRLHGQQIWTPADPRARPDALRLREHNERIYLG